MIHVADSNQFSLFLVLALLQFHLTFVFVLDSSSELCVVSTLFVISLVKKDAFLGVSKLGFV